MNSPFSLRTPACQSSAPTESLEQASNTEAARLYQLLRAEGWGEGEKRDGEGISQSYHQLIDFLLQAS